MMNKPVRFLISAGPTREKIDPVRFISNYSSGKMGYALAGAALAAGHQVVLVSGPVTLAPPPGLKLLLKVESAAEMAEAVKKASAEADIIIMAAAVADYRPAKMGTDKIKKSASTLNLELEKTEDILEYLGLNKKGNQLVIGFAAETGRLLENARAKLKAKQLDWIIANEVGRSDRGFDADQNEVVMISKSGREVVLPLAAKTAIANKIIAVLLQEKNHS